MTQQRHVAGHDHHVVRVVDEIEVVVDDRGESGEHRVDTGRSKDIAANGYNLDIKNPHEADAGPGDPDQLLADLDRIHPRWTFEKKLEDWGITDIRPGQK